MNIFVLDRDPALAAIAQCDKHVVKMMTESVQILCSALHLNGCKRLPMKPTHLNHPCVLWAAVGSGNWWWLFDHAKYLIREYEHRYQRETLVKAKLESLIDVAWRMDYGKSPFVCCVGKSMKPASNDETVAAYRQYYRDKAAKMQMRWTRRDPPKWFTVNPEAS